MRHISISPLRRQPSALPGVIPYFACCRRLAVSRCARGLEPPGAGLRQTGLRLATAQPAVIGRSGSSIS